MYKIIYYVERNYFFVRGYSPDRI